MFSRQNPKLNIAKGAQETAVGPIPRETDPTVIIPRNDTNGYFFLRLWRTFAMRSFIS